MAMTLEDFINLANETWKAIDQQPEEEKVSKGVLDLENQLRNLIVKLHLKKNFPAMRDHNTEEQIG